MRIVFFGTPEWAAVSLRAIHGSKHRVAAVVTATDKPVGRSGRSIPPAVKREAARLGLEPVLQPDTLRGRQAREAILAHRPDVLVVVAYGRILPGRLLDGPPAGAVNVHFSLLPRHRGASPVQYTILAGDSRAGVTTMRMDRGLDTGPILLQRETAVAEGETAPDLGNRLAGMGARLLVETLDGLESGSIAARPQDDSSATMAPLLRREMGLVRWDVPALQLERMVRAFGAWPAVVASSPRGSLRLLETRALAGAAHEGRPPGTVLGRVDAAFDVACGEDTVLRVERVQPESRRAMSGAAAIAGRYVEVGSRLGDGRLP